MVSRGRTPKKRGAEGRARRDGAGSAAQGLLPSAAVPSRGVPRHKRLERDLLIEVAGALGELSDPRLAGVTVTRVELSEDLQFARIYVRAAYDGKVAEKALMASLRAAKGRVRGEVGRVLALRKAPELRFMYDRGLEAAERVDAILAEIRGEREC
jgi:ribosome-binding factor A